MAAPISNTRKKYPPFCRLEAGQSSNRKAGIE
jgi:hypothetical protein